MGITGSSNARRMLGKVSTQVRNELFLRTVRNETREHIKGALDAGADVHVNNNAAFFSAIDNKCSWTVKTLLESADSSAINERLITHACVKFGLEHKITELLVDAMDSNKATICKKCPYKK